MANTMPNKATYEKPKQAMMTRMAMERAKNGVIVRCGGEGAAFGGPPQEMVFTSAEEGLAYMAAQAKKASW